MITFAVIVTVLMIVIGYLTLAAEFGAWPFDK